MENTKHDSVLDARESVEIEDFLTDLKWQGTEIDGQWLDPSEEYRRPEYTLSYKGIPFAPLGGIHGLTGQPGHGKTFTFTQLMLAILRGDYFGLKYEQSENIPNPKVLYIDTEMEKGNTQLVMLRIYDQMGWQIGSMHDEFRILWLREVTKAEERWRMVLKAIWTIRPTVVFLDGLIDVIGDFNDNKECQQIIYQCMACASHYRVSMWCLLHENPGSDKMVGHAGSFLERKATDVLKTKKDKTGATPYFTVTQNKARSRDLPDWHFTIEDDEHHYGHPVLTDGKNDDDSNDKRMAEKVKQAMLSFMWKMEGLHYKDIESGLKSYGITSNRMLSDYISIAQSERIIEKRDKRYFLLIDTKNIDNQASFALDDDNEKAPF